MPDPAAAMTSKAENEYSTTDTGRPSRAAGNFYGRRKAKTLKNEQADALARLLPELRLDLRKAAPDDLRQLFPDSPDKIVLEIGFGGGEHLIHRAMMHPETGFIGCEPFVNGMAKASQAIGANGLTNIRLYDEDATDLLNWLPERCLARIDLLYPDPWPKKRHWKRRFLNADNVKRFHRVLEDGGEFRFASDIENYVNWGLRHVMDHGGFEWTAQKASDWHQPWAEWISTRYEKKAIREGRPPAYFIFKRI